MTSLLLALLLLLSSCTTVPTGAWARVNPSQQDSYECFRDAQVPGGMIRAGYAWIPLSSGTDGALYAACMEARGYRYVRTR